MQTTEEDLIENEDVGTAMGYDSFAGFSSFTIDEPPTIAAANSQETCIKRIDPSSPPIAANPNLIATLTCSGTGVRVDDVAPSGYAMDRAAIKTGRPVRFELTDQARQAIDQYLHVTGRRSEQFLFAGRAIQIVD